MKELIEKAQSRDHFAFAALLELYKQDLYKLALAKLKNTFDVDDVIQETIISAYVKLPQLKDTSKFKMWLFKILINNCNMFYRKKKNIPTPFDDISSSLTSDETLFNRIDSRLNFYSILQPLTEKEKTIAILYYASDCSIKEISKILKMNSNTVKTNLKRIREKLKEKLIKGENIYE